MKRCKRNSARRGFGPSSADVRASELVELSRGEARLVLGGVNRAQGRTT